MKCYCGSEKEYSNCCEPFHKGNTYPSTSEELMRSRYSAFCVKNIEYLVDTTDPQARTANTRDAYAEWANAAQFTGLEILNSKDDGNKGSVEFKAHYAMDGETHLHHEASRFRKHQGTWYYREGRIKN